MEIEELNQLMWLKAFDEKSYERAIEELSKKGKEISPKNVFEMFDKYDIEAGLAFEKDEFEKQVSQR